MLELEGKARKDKSRQAARQLAQTGQALGTSLIGNNVVIILMSPFHLCGKQIHHGFDARYTPGRWHCSACIR